MLMALDAARAKPGQDFSWPFDSYQSELVNDDSRLFEWSSRGGEDSGEESAIEGFVFARLGFDGECEIMHMACAKVGCGSEMLTAWFEWAREQGLKKVFLEFHERNISARRLYEKLGFEKISERERYYRDGGRAILMSRLV